MARRERVGAVRNGRSFRLSQRREPGLNVSRGIPQNYMLLNPLFAVASTHLMPMHGHERFCWALLVLCFKKAFYFNKSNQDRIEIQHLLGTSSGSPAGYEPTTSHDLRYLLTFCRCISIRLTASAAFHKIKRLLALTRKTVFASARKSIEFRLENSGAFSTHNSIHHARRKSNE